MRTSLLNMSAMALMAAALLDAKLATAQTMEVPASVSTISDAALFSSTGNIAVNISAGAGNAQANVAVISAGEAHAAAHINNHQQVDSKHGKAPTRRGSAEIGAHAFGNTHGLITVNQSSGIGNTQANLVAVALGKTSEVSVEQLGRISASTEMPSGSLNDTDQPGAQKAAIADSAFAGAHGIVQVNQSAGSWNATANVFTLSVGVGAK